MLGRIWSQKESWFLMLEVVLQVSKEINFVVVLQWEVWPQFLHHLGKPQCQQSSLQKAVSIVIGICYGGCAVMLLDTQKYRKDICSSHPRYSLEKSPLIPARDWTSTVWVKSFCWERFLDEEDHTWKVIMAYPSDEKRSHFYALLSRPSYYHRIVWVGRDL